MLLSICSKLHVRGTFLCIDTMHPHRATKRGTPCVDVTLPSAWGNPWRCASPPTLPMLHDDLGGVQAFQPSLCPHDRCHWLPDARILYQFLPDSPFHHFGTIRSAVQTSCIYRICARVEIDLLTAHITTFKPSFPMERRAVAPSATPVSPLVCFPPSSHFRKFGWSHLSKSAHHVKYLYPIGPRVWCCSPKYEIDDTIFTTNM